MSVEREKTRVLAARLEAMARLEIRDPSQTLLVSPPLYVQVFGNCVPLLILFFTICLICCYYILRKIKANNTDGSGFGFLKSGSGSAKKPIRSNSVPDRIRKHCTLKQKSMLFRTVEVVIWLKNALLGSGLQDGGYEPV